MPTETVRRLWGAAAGWWWAVAVTETATQTNGLAAENAPADFSSLHSPLSTGTVPQTKRQRQTDRQREGQTDGLSAQDNIPAHSSSLHPPPSIGTVPQTACPRVKKLTKPAGRDNTTLWLRILTPSCHTRKQSISLKFLTSSFTEIPNNNRVHNLQNDSVDTIIVVSIRS